MAHTDQTQDRGDLSSYDRYLRGMDTSMRQKVALTAAHLLGQGKVADMGMGSGLGSQALASLYPNLEVVGVDLDPTMVALAHERHRLPNLTFVEGDIARAVFSPQSLDGIFDSSVLHHVTSYGGYRYANALEALEAQAAQLKPGGVLIVRDFLAPGTQDVLLDLPADDGEATSDPRSCSTAHLFERFATEFRSLSPGPGFPFQTLGAVPDRPEWRRYRVSLHHATEFILRKDYRWDWEAEVKEEYGYFTQAEFEGHFARLGLRMLASTPIRNPWILRNRWEGKCLIRDLDGTPRPFPATNYLIVGERVPSKAGVAFRDGGIAQSGRFLHMAHFRHRESGAVFDLVQRPFPTLDVLPWFRKDGDLYVLARMSYPRPILGAMPDASPILDERRPSSYLTEPLTAIQTDQPTGFTVEAMLLERASLAPDQLMTFREGATYYPSPGGILEEVRSTLVEVAPTFMQDHFEHQSGFSTSGRVHAIEARQLLRAAQVGGLSDARLELNVYELLLQLSEGFGDWIGEEIRLGNIESPPELTTWEALLARPHRRQFEPARPDESLGYLNLNARTFEEVDAFGEVLNTSVLEYVVPAKASTNTLAAVLIFRHQGTVYLGLEDRDLPGPQGFTGHSDLLTAPAWRLPQAVTSMPVAREWLRQELARHCIQAGSIWDLGGAYHPTPGLTPECVHPLAVEIISMTDRTAAYHWIPLNAWPEVRHQICDGHLRILVSRLRHALQSIAVDSRS